jgi:MFS transporter, ACS family, hexuronate transporter
MLGSLVGGWLSGHLIRRGWTIDHSRKSAITLGGLIMVPALIGAPLATDPTIAVLTISAALFGFQVAIGNIQTLPADVFSGKSVGTLAGVGGMAAVAGTLITTWLVPVMTQTSYAPIFLLVAALVPLSVLFVWLVGGRIHKVQPPTGPQAPLITQGLNDAFER